jgi:prevent-host-death family protein
MAAHPKPLPSLEPKPLVRMPASKRLGTPPRKIAITASSRDPVAAAKAKTHFLQLLDEVERDRRPITITKRGRVVAQLIPASEPQPISAFDQVFGSMKGSIKITGDIVSPDWESWGPEWR